MKRFYLLLLAMLASVNSYAQTDEGTNYFDLVPQVVSPQLEAMMRSDQMQAALNTGKIDLTLPVIDFSDPDFDFPITISYDSGGFIPSLSDNYVGRNWSLNIGGAIYRTVNGIADESECYEQPTNQHVLGFLYAAKNPATYIDNEALLQGFLSNPDAYTDCLPLKSSYRFIKGTNIEASPDIFTFSFGRHSGKFIITYDGTVKVLSNSGGKYKVDISDFNVNTTAYVTGVNSATIRITTDDGYVYSFGGSYDALEYMAHGWDSRSTGEAFSLGRKQNQINAFYLSKIKAPNGRELTLNYRQVGLDYHQSSASVIYSTDPNLGVNYSFAGKPFALSNQFLSLSNSDNIETNTAITKNIYSINKIALISDITMDDKKIEFNFSPRLKTSFETSDSYCQFASKCGAQLNSVVMYDRNEKVVERCDFKYNYNSCRMFLTQIQHSKLGTHLFNYNLGEIPGIFERNIDHWGFWRGNTPHQRDIPKINAGDYTLFENTYSIISDDRDATGDCFDRTLLKEVVYPTGGKVEFEYEPNDCLFKVKNGYDGVCWEANDNGKSEIVGGARIKSIKHYDNVNNTFKLVKHNIYKYGSSKSSSNGTAEYMPHYVLFNHQLRLYDPPRFSSMAHMNSEGFNSPGYNTNHITYETVREYQVESVESIADSSRREYITPLDAVRAKRLDVSVGYFGDLDNSILPHYSRSELSKIESQYSQWIIQGSSASASIVGKVTIKSNNQVVREYSFNSNNTTPVIFNPVSELPKGRYTVILQADSSAYLSFTAKYPYTGGDKIAGAYKVINFIGYRANYNNYNCSYPFFVVDRSSQINLPNHTYGEWRACLSDPSMICKLDPSKEHSDQISLFASDFDLHFYQKFFADYIRPLDRGKISQEYYYDRNNRPIRFIQYIYGDKGKGNIVSYIRHQASNDVLKTAAIAHFMCMPFFTNHLTSKTVTDYDGLGNSMIVNKENYDYDNDGYLKGKTVLNSNGETAKTIYSNANDSQNELFVEKNMLSTIIEERNEVVKGDAPTQLTRIKRYFKSIVNTDNLAMPVVDYVMQEIGEATPQTKVRCLNYDKYGNPIYVINDESKHTVYLWSYGGKYMVAKIENTSYDQVKNALPGINIEDLSSQSSPNMGLIDGLRISLPLAHVTTYTYYPSIGMASQTAPSGKVVNYSYDNCNRLMDVSTVGLNGVEILIKNRYNIVNK